MMCILCVNLPIMDAGCSFVREVLFLETGSSHNSSYLANLLPLHPPWAKPLYHLLNTLHSSKCLYKFINLCTQHILSSYDIGNPFIQFVNIYFNRCVLLLYIG